MNDISTLFWWIARYTFRKYVDYMIGIIVHVDFLDNNRL